MTHTRQLLGCVATAVVVLSAGAEVLAQTIPRGRGTTADDIRREAQRRRDLLRELNIRKHTFPYNLMPKEVPMPYHLGYRPGLQEMFPHYEGLPTYPENVPGYGAYPGAKPRPPSTRAAPPRPIEPRTGRWPSWIEGGLGPGVGKATPGQAKTAACIKTPRLISMIGSLLRSEVTAIMVADRPATPKITVVIATRAGTTVEKASVERTAYSMSL